MIAEFEPLVAAQDATGYYLRAVRGEHESMTHHMSSIAESMKLARQLESEGWLVRIDYVSKDGWLVTRDTWTLFFQSIGLAHQRVQN